MNPVAQRLAVHAGQAGSILPRPVINHHRERQQTARFIGITTPTPRIGSRENRIANFASGEPPPAPESQ
jgi:hypothetical protein